MKLFKHPMALLMAVFLFQSGAHAQLAQQKYIHQTSTEEIRCFDIATNPGGYQVLALNSGLQEVINISPTGAHVSDYSADMGADFLNLESKTMAVKESGETVLAGIENEKLKIAILDQSGSVIACREFDAWNNVGTGVDGTSFGSIYEMEISEAENAVFIHALVKHHYPGEHFQQWSNHVIARFSISGYWISPTWMNIIGDPLNYVPQNNTDDADGKYGDMYPTSDNGVVYTGPVLLGGYIELCAFKFDNSGNTDWAMGYYDNPQYVRHEGTAICEVQYSGETQYVIAGIDASGKTVIIGVDNTGQVAWEKEYAVSSNDLEGTDIIIRGLLQADDGENVVAVGELKTGSKSIGISLLISANSLQINLAPGDVISGNQYPDYERCRDLVERTGGYAIAAEARARDNDPLAAGVLLTNISLETDCSAPFVPEVESHDVAAYERGAGDMFTPDWVDEEVMVTFDHYDDDENCCSTIGGVITVHMCDPDGVLIGSSGGGGTDDPRVWGHGTADNAVVVDQPGDYPVVILHSDGCWSLYTYNVVNSQNVLTLDNSATQNITCHGDQDGEICFSSANPISSVGGTGPNGTFGQGLSSSPTYVCLSSIIGSGLDAGIYSITVTDIYGCDANLSHGITEPSAIAIASSQTSTSSGCDGQLSFTVTGGVTNYTYDLLLGSTTIATGSSSSSSYLFGSLCAGLYTFNITDANGCTDQNIIEVNDGENKRGSGGLEHVNGSKIIVYPNPSNGHLQIQLPKDMGGIIEVTDITGRSVIQQSFSATNTVEFNLNDQPAGNYIIQINSGQVVHHEKITLVK